MNVAPAQPPAAPAQPITAVAQSTAPTRRPRRITFGQLNLTVVTLAAMGLIGSIAWSVVFALLSAGIGLLFAFGIGVFVLVGLVYVLFGIAWFEVERVNLLYRFDTPRLALRPRFAPGFGGYLRTLGKQAIDGRMWRALVSFALATVFGLVILRALWFGVWALTLLFAPLGGSDPLVLAFGFEVTRTFAPVWGLLAAALAFAATAGLALAHAAISRALLALPTRGALAAEVRTKSAQREGAVRAADLERTRIERDLHDGVQPRLVSVGMTLGLAQQKIDSDPAAAKALIEEAHTSTKAAITELRQLARGIHASVLDDRGLDAALSALAGRSHIPVHLDVRLDGRPPVAAGAFRDAEAAVYFSIAESLTNAAKHSRASEARVVVRLRDPGTPAARLWARIEDNGIGGAEVQPGGGLDGISNRVLAAGGTLTLDSPHGGPTTVEVSVPCAF